MTLERLKIAAVYLFLLLYAIPLFHANVVEAFFPDVHKRMLAGNSLYRQILVHSYKIGLGIHWHMYSPVESHVYWVSFDAEMPDGKRVEIDLPLISPEYREQRSPLSAHLFDFKIGRQQKALAYDSVVRASFAGYLCRMLIEGEGRDVTSVHAIMNRAAIPRPSERGAWTPFAPTNLEHHPIESYSCSS